MKEGWSCVVGSEGQLGVIALERSQRRRYLGCDLIAHGTKDIQLFRLATLGFGGVEEAHVPPGRGEEERADLMRLVEQVLQAE